MYLILTLLLGLIWLLFLPSTKFNEEKKYIYIRSSTVQFDQVIAAVKDSNFVRTLKAFEFISSAMDLQNKFVPGKYEIKKGMSLFEIGRMFRNKNQAIVKLTITKLRTKEQLASFIGKKFETDSASFMKFINNNDSIAKFGIDTSKFMTLLLPETYNYNWNSTPGILISKWQQEQKRFWTEERVSKASNHGLTKETTYILASIIEEETNYKEDKGVIASVYLNRIAKKMPLQADPTVKFALRNFGIKRIYQKHLAADSPYNTYQHTGWPPGPICIPSKSTIESVLDAPTTNYLYFVAKSDFSGKHVFSETYSEHLSNARLFQDAQDKQDEIRKNTH